MNIIEFLTILRKNNNRDWFNENKHLFLETRDQFLVMVDAILKGLEEIDPSVRGQESKDTIYRIYRDVRFSKNKLPYKSHFGAFFAPGGRRSTKAGYYIRIEPGNCIIGGGLHCPKGEVLKEVRFEIYNHADEFGKIINANSFKKAFGTLRGDKLKRPPKGFPGEFPQIEWLKHKDFIAVNPVSDEMVMSENFVPYVLEVFSIMKPLNDFINRAI
jgi:uncharacterized protein (TIGR02453 family)